MAAAGRTLSPGGALLRASRIFSLPSGLPPPPGDYQAATNYNSETATQAFPTLQTVTVPESFRQRGDWGFKRNFPLRSTAKTSTPFLRVKQVDSIEHVTDFASAANHTLTLEKWQEMNIAISLPHTASNMYQPMNNPLESVFEDKYDFTAIDSEKISGSNQRRWKYKGPWLANLTEGEFQTYIKREVRGRRAEFRQFLRQERAATLTAEARQRAVEAVQRAMDDGSMDQKASEEIDVPEVRPEDVTDEQILDFLRSSREHRGQLYEVIEKFLDLAPIEPPGDEAADSMGSLQPFESKKIESANPYAKHGPPITHPSAGLSYLRTNSFIENHPVYGPQRKHKSVKARVMIPDSTGQPKIAVGGFISPSQAARTEFRSTNMDKVDFTKPGGSKMWVNVTSAQINPIGRALVNVEEAGFDERMVQQEMEGERQLFRAEVEDPTAKARQLRRPFSSKSLSRKPATWKTGSPDSYGSGGW